MRETDYAYAVARVRAHESRLLTRADLDRLLTAADEAECRRILADRGYPARGTAAEMLSAEMADAWALLRELAPDLHVFDVLLCRSDYHNAKAAIKGVVTSTDCALLFLPEGRVPPETIRKAVTARDFSVLPADMQAPAAEALTVLLETGDGQRTDMILDTAQLRAMLAFGQASGCAFLAQYAALMAAQADIKTVVRCARMQKSASFMRRATVDCPTLDVPALIDRAVRDGADSVPDALALTPYAAAADALRSSMAAFETWCDDAVIDALAGAKTKPFGPEPLAAYVLGKENEIKTVRIILSARHNGLPDDAVRARIRTLY